MADNITINQGTQSAIAADDVSSVWYQKIKLDVGADGLSEAFTGTITEITNLAAGTITKVEGGTIGNVASGTINTNSLIHADSFGSVGTIAGTATGTVHALVSGSAIHVTDIVISTNGATEVTIGDGTPTVPLLGPLFLAANGGMVGNLVTPLETTDGSALVYNQSGAGTISVTVKGYID